MRKDQRGYVDGEAIFALLVIGFIGLLLFAALFVRFKTNNEVVSGIAYNTTNDALISGNTNFSVRAGENTPVSTENQSTYCLPPNSPYKDLVNRAAADKRIKITVESGKYFAIQLPWTCNSNVKVTEVK